MRTSVRSTIPPAVLVAALAISGALTGTASAQARSGDDVRGECGIEGRATPDAPPRGTPGGPPGSRPDGGCDGGRGVRAHGTGSEAAEDGDGPGGGSAVNLVFVSRTTEAISPSRVQQMLTEEFPAADATTPAPTSCTAGGPSVRPESTRGSGEAKARDQRSPRERGSACDQAKARDQAQARDQRSPRERGSVRDQAQARDQGRDGVSLPVSCDGAVHGARGDAEDCAYRFRVHTAGGESELRGVDHHIVTVAAHVQHRGDCPGTGGLSPDSEALERRVAAAFARRGLWVEENSVLPVDGSRGDRPFGNGYATVIHVDQCPPGSYPGVSPTPSSSVTLLPVPTETPTPSSSVTLLPVPTETPTPSSSVTLLPVPTETPTPSSSVTLLPVPTETPTPSSSVTLLPGPTPTPTPTSSVTLLPGPTDSPDDGCTGSDDGACAVVGGNPSFTG